MSTPEKPFIDRNINPNTDVDGEHIEHAPEHTYDLASLQEFKRMLEGIAVDEHNILEILEDSLLEPIPDPNDAEAVKRFNDKMALIKEMAFERLGRSQMLEQIRSQIEERIAQAG